MEFFDGDIREHHSINKERWKREEERLKKLYLNNYNDWLMLKYKKSENEQKKSHKFETESEYNLSGLLVHLWTPFVTFSIIFFICMFLLWLIVS